MNGRLHGPIRAAAGLDGREIGPLQGLAIFRQIQLPEGKEFVGHVQSFQAAVGTVEDFMAGIDTEDSKVLGYLGEVIELKHFYLRKSNTGRNACATTTQAGMPVPLQHRQECLCYLIPARSCNKCQFSSRSCWVDSNTAEGLPSLSKCLAKRPSVRAKYTKSICSPVFG